MHYALRGRKIHLRSYSRLGVLATLCIGLIMLGTAAAVWVLLPASRSVIWAAVLVGVLCLGSAWANARKPWLEELDLERRTYTGYPGGPTLPWPGEPQRVLLVTDLSADGPPFRCLFLQFQRGYPQPMGTTYGVLIDPLRLGRSLVDALCNAAVPLSESTVTELPLDRLTGLPAPLTSDAWRRHRATKLTMHLEGIDEQGIPLPAESEGGPRELVANPDELVRLLESIRDHCLDVADPSWSVLVEIGPGDPEAPVEPLSLTCAEDGFWTGSCRTLGLWGHCGRYNTALEWLRLWLEVCLPYRQMESEG